MRNIVNLKIYFCCIIICDVKYCYLMMKRILIGRYKGVYRDVGGIYRDIVKLIRNVKYYKKKNKEEKNSNKRAFCAF